MIILIAQFKSQMSEWTRSVPFEASMNAIEFLSNLL